MANAHVVLCVASIAVSRLCFHTLAGTGCNYTAIHHAFIREMTLLYLSYVPNTVAIAFAVGFLLACFLFVFIMFIGSDIFW
jgi:hypothetical protein